jgi:hypothetical protein
MLAISLAFARSSLCFVGFSSTCWDGPIQAVDGEATTPLFDDAWNPVDIPLSDMTLSVLKSRRTSVTNSSIAVSSSDIHTQEK